MDERISHYIEGFLLEIRPTVQEFRDRNPNNLDMDLEDMVGKARDEGGTYRARFISFRGKNPVSNGLIGNLDARETSTSQKKKNSQKEVC